MMTIHTSMELTCYMIVTAEHHMSRITLHMLMACHLRGFLMT